MIQTIDDFKIAVQRNIEVLKEHISDDYYPRSRQGKVLTFNDWIPVTFDTPLGDGTPFVELEYGQFSFIISERGEELKKITGNADKILAEVFNGITFELACKFELNNRITGQDSRRLIFSKQIELLSLLDKNWASLRFHEQENILKNIPWNSCN